jgi:glutamyl-tRNA reductase
MQHLTRGLTQKMLHGAMAELHSADTLQRQAVAEWLSRLFLRDDDHHASSAPPHE